MVQIFPVMVLAVAGMGPSPVEGVCHAAHKASAAVSQTVQLLAVEVAVDGDGSGITLQWRKGASHSRLGVPVLRLGLLEELSLSLQVSIAVTAGTGCGGLAGWGGMAPGALDLAHVVPIPQATVAVRYRPRVALSLLAPWTALLTRLGEPGAVRGSVSVGVGVSTGVMLGGASPRGGSAVGYPGATVSQQPSGGSWSAPTLRPPTLPSFPVSTPRPQTGTSRR